MKLNEVLKAIRESEGLTANGLHRATDGQINSRRVYDIEEGKSSISISTLEKIADKLGYEITCEIKKTRR